MNRSIEEQYQIISAVSLGRAYRMYVAEHQHEHTRWAIKEVKRPQGIKSGYLDRAKLLQKMNDPVLPVIRELYDDGSMLSTVEEYIPGVDLRSCIEQSGTMEETDVLDFMKAIAGFMYRLHNMPDGMLLRDLDPSSLRLMPDNSVRMVDYSVLCGLREPDFSGGYGFVAPELRTGGKVGPWTDVYALGVVAYYALTGKDPDESPYRFLPLRHHNPKASAGIEYILNKCLQQDPKDRYQSAEELLYDLEHIHRFDKVLKRYKLKKVLRVASVLLVLAAACGLMFYGRLTMQNENRDAYRVLLNNASALADDGNYDEAFKRLTQAQDMLPDDVRSYELWAELLYQQGDYVQCAEYSTSLLAQFPESRSLIVNLAMSDYEIGEYRLASEYFRLAGDANLNQEQRRDYIISLIRIDKVSEAGVIYSDHSGGWDYATAYYLQGELYAARGELAEAAAALAGALQESSDAQMTFNCVLLLSDVYVKAAAVPDSGIENPVELALPQLEAYVNNAEYADNPQLHANYARVLAISAAQSKDKGLWESAAENMRRAIDMGLNSVDNYILLCSALSGADRHEEALTAALEAESRYPSSWQIRARSSWEEIMIQDSSAVGELDFAVAYGEYAMAESLLGDSEADELMIALRARIQELLDEGYIAQ